MAAVPYSIICIGEAKLHLLQLSKGKFFVMGEIASQLFEESPAVLMQDVKAGRYTKLNSSSAAVLNTIAKLGLPVEGSAATAGVVLLPQESVIALLRDHRKNDLVQRLKLGMLKLSSQSASKLMAAGQYELALPVALEALQQGCQLFQPAPALQLFPLYLLAAQAHLGLRNMKECEELLGLAAWLAFNEPEKTTHVMRAQLARIYGQLYSLLNRHEDALKSFADEVVQMGFEHGPEEVRTSLGYYSLACVFRTLGRADASLANCDMVVSIWRRALQRLVLGEPPSQQESLECLAGAPARVLGPDGGLPLAGSQLREVLDMLQEICRTFAEERGPQQSSVAEVHFIAALLLIHMQEGAAAGEQLTIAAALWKQAEGLAEQQAGLAKARALIEGLPA